MKTKNLLKVLSLTVLLGGLAKVSSFSDLKSAGSEKSMPYLESPPRFSIDGLESFFSISSDRSGRHFPSSLSYLQHAKNNPVSRFGVTSIPEVRIP